MNFELLVERKQRNPLRKRELRSSNVYDWFSPENFQLYKDYYLNTPYNKLENDNDRVIRRKYEGYLKTSEELADKYLKYEVNRIHSDIKRTATKKYKKIYEYQGVQVFLDEENVDDVDYVSGSYNYRMVQNSVLFMLMYVKDILPNKKPKVVITSLQKHPYTGKYYHEDNPSAGMAGNKLMFIDQYYVDSPDVWVHEYAHWVADLIPTQTQDMLINAFKKFVDIYYKKSKLRNPMKRGKEISDVERQNISEKLGFPRYGLSNHDEFFAVLIENWKKLPPTKLTYKFKSLVKNVLTRL